MPLNKETKPNQTEWGNAQRVSAPTTTILLTTVDTYYGLNFFAHGIYTSKPARKKYYKTRVAKYLGTKKPQWW